MAEQKRTVFSQKALDLSEVFAIQIGVQPVGGGTYKVQLSAPDGPSTGGGVQGVQHVTLVPAAGGAATVVGSANQGAQKAELRSYARVLQVHRQRGRGETLGLDEKAYGELLDRMKKFFASSQMSVTVEGPEPEAAPEQPAPKPFPWMSVAIGAAALVLLALVVLVVRAH